MSSSASSSYFKSILRHNLSTFRSQPLTEISGSLGDLGTFLPILIALSSTRQVSLATTLIFTGLFNIATGVGFGIPLPVQPMKAIAAVAILRRLSAGEVCAAGVFVAACIAFFSVTGLLGWFSRVIPVPVVKGIQVGAGLSLIIAAGGKALGDLGWTGPSWADNRIWLMVLFLLLFATNLKPRVPFALLVTIVGVIFAVLRIVVGDHADGHGHGHLPRLRSWSIHTVVPRAGEWRVGVLDAGLGQLPLTTLNSVIAVVHLAADLLPDVPTPSVTAVGLSVAAMNFVGCWLGAMPVCHGSGGLAAQYRFGARSGASIIFLGLVKLVLGLVFGESLSELLHRFPLALLTVMIIAAGLELASVGESLNSPTKARDLRKETSDRQGEAVTESQSKERWTVMMVTAGTLVAFKNDAVGFVAGMCCHYSYMMKHRLKARRAGRDEEQRPLLS